MLLSCRVILRLGYCWYARSDQTLGYVFSARGAQSSEMTRTPLVSIVTTFLNAERFLQEAIESVLTQTYDDWELLLVDDGSTDRSTQIALRHADQYPEKVRYLEHADHQNRGTSASRNLGIRESQGRYIAFLDADDVWLPNKLAEQVAILEAEPEAAMVYGLSQYWRSWTGHPEDAHRDTTPPLGIAPGTLVRPPTLLTRSLEATARAPCPSDLLERRQWSVLADLRNTSGDHTSCTRIRPS
jgi:glycosyltransferase involved in cell wall biosynthesis